MMMQTIDSTLLSAVEQELQRATSTTTTAAGAGAAAGWASSAMGPAKRGRPRKERTLAPATATARARGGASHPIPIAPLTAMPLSSSSSSSSSSSTIIPSSASSCKPRVLLPQPTITVAAPLQQLRLQAIPLHAIAQAAPSAGVCLVVPSSNTQPHPEPPVSYLTPISERSSLALAVAPPLPKPPTTRGLDIPSHSAASPAGFNEGVRAQSPGAGVRDNRVKLAHVASEKRRRDSIQVGFDELRTVVPDCSSCYSKASVLQRTLSYIRTFQRANGRVSGAIPTAPAPPAEDVHKQQPPLHHHGAPNQVADALLQQQNAMIAVLRASPFLSEAQQNELVAQFTAKSSVDLWANMPNNAPAFASGALRPLTPACSLSTASMSDDDDEPATPSSLSD